MIYGTLNPEKIWHEILQICPPHLSYVATLPWEIQNTIFNSISHTCFWLSMLSQKKTNLPTSPENVTTLWNSWNAKLFHLTEGFIRFFKRWWLWKEPVVGWCQWLRKEPVATRDNWNVRQAKAQQVFKTTTFFMDTCFHSFSTLISRIVHHSVLNSTHVATSRCRKPQHVHINTRAPL